jgi:glyoxylase-like metal-dependent hydrolase (beta-lactamase superfamily II)
MDPSDEPSRIHQTAFDARRIQGSVACYLIDGPEPILVDTGLPSDERTLASAIAEHDRTLEAIEHLLVTHPHSDHLGGVPELLDAAEPTVYAPVGLRERFGRKPGALEERLRRNAIGAGLSGDRLEAAVAMAVDSIERNRELLSPEAVDRWIEPGESTEIGGFDVDAVHLPGHQADQLGYRLAVGSERVLVAGDAGIKPFRPIVVHDGIDDGCREAFGAFYATLDRLEALDVDRVAPGHGPMHDDLESVVERDRASLDARLDRVLDLVTGGRDTAVAVAEELRGERGIYHLIPETVGALAHLESTDRLHREVIDGVSHYRPIEGA